MKDGLYLVDRNNVYAAFVVRGGEVTICAPILRNKLDYWKRIAKYVPPMSEEQDEYPPPWHIDVCGMPV